MVALSQNYMLQDHLTVSSHAIFTIYKYTVFRKKHECFFLNTVFIVISSEDIRKLRMSTL